VTIAPHRAVRRVFIAMSACSVVLAACGGSSKSPSSTTLTSTASDSVVSMPVDTVAPGMRDTIVNGPPEGTKQFAGLLQDHTTEPVTYDQVPPVGGAHSPRWQECAYYDAAIQNERGVHSMEHGAVWITYSPDLPADQVSTLRSMATGHSHLLISPYPGLPAPVVASAWGEQLVLQSVSDPRLAAFVAYFEQGPQTPEPGAPCA